MELYVNHERSSYNTVGRYKPSCNNIDISEFLTLRLDDFSSFIKKNFNKTGSLVIEFLDCDYHCFIYVNSHFGYCGR